MTSKTKELLFYANPETEPFPDSNPDKRETSALLWLEPELAAGRVHTPASTVSPGRNRLRGLFRNLKGLVW
jgi:hypothetical protein